jgi:2-polyprenyl-3-methyl-5-hydroxy-6-metoxy-1,4-benzoquinol methylase
MPDDPWFAGFFRDVAVNFWSDIVPLELTAAEAGFLTDALELTAPARILDVPCGNGRHAIEFARRGHSVTGIDISEDFLIKARRAAAEANVDVDWRQADMRELAATTANDAHYDAAFCWGNSFGYLDHPEASAFVSTLARALRPGGRFVADIATAAESLIPGLISRQWHRAGDTFVLSDARYDAARSRVDIDYTFVHGGKSDTRRATSYVMTAAECARLFEAAGLKVLDMVGSIAGEPYTLGSPHLLLLAEKH